MTKTAQILQTIQTLSLQDIFVYVCIALILIVVLQALRMLIMLIKNKHLGIITKPYSNLEAEGKRILILGDSTAVGTGAARIEDTIGGQLGRDFPKARIENVAENGALTRDLVRQLKKVQLQQYDFIIVSAGGNDVWHLTRPEKIAKILQDVLPQLLKLSRGRLIFLVYNNIGSAPVFPSLLSSFLKRRCQKIQDTIREIAFISHVPTIELFSDEQNNPFAQEPKRLFAADGIHPSSEGYRLWYKRMWRIMHEHGYHLNWND